MKTLCVDFDGVLRAYPDGQQAAVTMDDAPVEGALEAMQEYVESFTVIVLTANSAGPLVCRRWLQAHGFPDVEVTDTKPEADVYLDDRGWRFSGTFPSVDQIEEFRPWWARDDKESTEQAAQSAIAQAEAHEPEVTSVLEELAHDTQGYLVGLEFRIKSERSTQEKIEAYQDEGKDIATAAASVLDVLRYTIVYPAADYAQRVTQALDRLWRMKYPTERVRNYWQESPSNAEGDYPDGTYAGINAILKTPDGYSFEIQFHTPESRMVNAANQALYRALEKDDSDEAGKAGIAESMRTNIETMYRPEGIEGWNYSVSVRKFVQSLP